jgi:hypothetical protein
MSKLEEKLRLSLIAVHLIKAADLRERASLAISVAVKTVLEQLAEQHEEDAERLAVEMQELAS